MLLTDFWLFCKFRKLRMKWSPKEKSSLIFYQIPLLWNSQNREHQKYLWNSIVLREISQ